MAKIRNQSIKFISPKQSLPEIILAEVKERLKKMSNWITPELDHVQVFWIKHFIIFHEKSYKVQGILKWLSTDRSTLIYNDEAKGTDPRNY